MGEPTVSSVVNPNLEQALAYALTGWKVFPIYYVKRNGTCSCGNPKCDRSIGKHPKTKNGFNEATTDPEVIKAWWNADPSANIGLATGHGNLTVLDVDVRENKKGDASLATLEAANSLLPPTLEVRTGSGGRHLYFIAPEAVSGSTSKVGKDLDVRGTGGYVILPPSNYITGGKYQWVNFGTPIAPLPLWLFRVMTGGKSSTASDKLAAASETPEARAKNRPKEADYDKLTAQQLQALLEFIPSECDRDTWWKVGAALKNTLGDKGFVIWDDWSSKAPSQYDPNTIQRQWDSFEDKGITAGTVVHFAKEGGFKSFEAVVADDPELVKGWVHVTAIKRFVNVARLTEWDREQFDGLHAHLFAKGRPSDHMLRNPEFRKLESATYWPAKPLFVEEGGQTKLNYWRPSDVRPCEGSVQPFLDHVNYLYPDPKEANILLSYLAFQVQCPGEKVHWALLLEGDPGAGKSYFATVMSRVLGEHNVATISSEQLHESFTGWQRNTQFIVVEEMMAKQRLELMNKLKPMITESWCQIREMYRPTYKQANRFNFLFFTNHKDSLLIDKGDRRYCILATEAPPHPGGDDYYKGLFGWTRENAAALLYYFANLDLSQFKPKAHAPMTDGKRALIEESLSPLEHYLREQVTNCEWPCENDLIVPSTLTAPLKTLNISTHPKAIGKAFERLGFLNLRQIREDSRSEGKKITLWAVRDFERYRGKPEKELRELYKLQQYELMSKVDKLSDAEILQEAEPKNPVIEREPFGAAISSKANGRRVKRSIN